MKILKLLIVSVFALVASNAGGVESKLCDSQCDQGYPYSTCNGPLNLYHGVSLDGKNNVLFTGKYNSSQGKGGFGLPSMNSVPTVGGGLTELFTIQGEIADGPGSISVDYFYKYLPISNKFYMRFNKAGAPIFGIYDQVSNSIQQVWNIFNTPFAPAFNKNETYFAYGAYGIYGLNKLPTQKEDSQLSELLYQSQIVNQLIFDNTGTGKDLYMTSYDGVLLKGNTDCKNCTKDQLVTLLTDKEASSATGLAFGSDDFIYFSYSGGIKGYPKSGDTSRLRQIVSENVVSMVSDGNVLYYTTDSGIVKSVTTAGNHPQVTVLYTPVSNGQCQCAVGFTGDDCHSCDNGMVLWSSSGLPTCTKLNEFGKPSQCYNSYQCGSTPFVICNGQCSCITGFSGPDCSTCNGEIVWNNGNPTCKSN